MTEITVTHEPTGAKVPMLIVNKDPIKYTENLKDRKAYTIDMLSKRWLMSVKDCADVLQAFQVPAYLHHPMMGTTNLDLRNALSYAMFFEEYIYALEDKLGHPKKKIKSRLLSELIKKDEK